MLKTTTLRLPVDLLRDAKIHAVKAGSTLQAVVADALRAYLPKARKEARS